MLEGPGEENHYAYRVTFFKLRIYLLTYLYHDKKTSIHGKSNLIRSFEQDMQYVCISFCHDLYTSVSGKQST